MATTTQAKTSGGKPAGQQKPAPARPQAAPTTSAALQKAAVSGPPKVTLDPIGAKISPDEIDLSTGEVRVPDKTAAEVKEGGELETRVRLPGLAEGTLKVRKRGGAFHSSAPQAILLRHPALARFTASYPTVLVLNVKDGAVAGFVGVGTPGPAKGNKHTLIDTMAKSADLLNWAGLSNLRFPAIRNQFTGGVIDVGADNLSFTVGGFLSGGGSVALDNKALAFDGTAKVSIPGGSSGELIIKSDPASGLAGKLDIMVQIGSVGGTVTATLSKGFVSIMGSAAYSGDRLSGKVTLVATDEATARDITLLKPSGGDVPIELPGPDKPARPGKRAFAGWGTLSFRVTDWLAGSATVIINSKGQATIVGEIAPPKEFILFEQKEWIKKLFKLEVKAGYGIPVVGQVGLFANIGLDAIAKIGPGKLYNIKLSGAYSTDPRVAKNLTIEASLNISAFAGLRLRAEAGLVVTILGHDIKAGVGLNAIAGVRGYVEATPRIGMRELAPGGKREYFIQGHLEIAAQPVLGFSGDLFVAIETPWWSPLSDKRWTWPLFELEYPLPGEFGIGADVDYVLGSKKWPKIEFGEVNFDSSKFMTDLMNDNTDKGGGKEQKKPGDWEEGLGAKGKGGAKNKGGAGKGAGDTDDDIGPIGEEETFSDGTESHRLWIEQRGTDASLMMASKPGPIEKQLAAWSGALDLLAEADGKKAKALIEDVRARAAKINDKAKHVAAMKVATRRAKEVYEKNKGKKGKKVAKGKSGGKELNKEVKGEEKALQTKLTALAVLMVEVPFEPIEKEPQMFGGKERVSIVSEKTHAGLRIARRKGTGKLEDIVGKLIPPRSQSGTANAAFKELGNKIEVIEKDIAQAKIKSGRINLRVKKSLDKPAQKIESLIARMGDRMRIPSLERAGQFVRIPSALLRAMEFVAHPKSPDGSIYSKRFIAEMKRQVADQRRGLNALSVDEWMHNLARFSLNRKTYLALDALGRAELLTVLEKRAAAAKARTLASVAREQKAVAALKAKMKLNKDEMQKLEARERRLQRALERQMAVATAEQELADVRAGKLDAPRREKLKPYYKDSDDEKMDLAILGRQHQERAARDAVDKAALEKLIAREKKWEGLAAITSELAILHRPDQVAGGYDKFETLPPVPKSDDDVDGWKTYLDALKKMFGPSNVNSDIGKQWEDKVRNGQVDVRKAVPVKIAYPIHQLNFTMSVV